LIRRICNSLEKTALADMTGAVAARQLKAGLWALRRIARSPDFSDTLLADEIADMETLLRLPAEPSTTPDALRARHLALQARLIDIDRQAQAARATGEAEAEDGIRALRSLYRRMLMRELSEPEGAPQ
jgi:hypothetical protein